MSASVLVFVSVHLLPVEGRQRRGCVGEAGPVPPEQRLQEAGPGVPAPPGQEEDQQGPLHGRGESILNTNVAGE